MANLVIVGAQWGDEGKGKIIDLLTEQADAVIRFQGGNNAGHTVVFDNQKYVLHLIPCGILHPGKICLIGNGVVVDPVALLHEIETLQRAGIQVGENLKISGLCHVTFSFHRAIDQALEKKRGESKIDTTHRGIGPTYRDKFARLGIRLVDLLDSQGLEKRLQLALDEKNFLFEKYFDLPPFQIQELLVEYAALGKKIAPFLADVTGLVNQLLDDGKKVLFEGAQGTFLDVDFGTYPFVTASHPTAGGACTGTGVGPTRIEKILGVVKAYTTRVGAGPLLTELPEGGIDLRGRGKEFGATTGRPRRCGWFDAVGVRRARIINGFDHMALTKLDVLTGLEKVMICVAYKLDGKIIDYFPDRLEEIQRIEPVYEEMPGWKKDISHMKSFGELPDAAQAYVKRIEKLVGAKISLISLGEDRNQTIVLDQFLIN